MVQTLYKSNEETINSQIIKSYLKLVSNVGGILDMS